MGSLAWAGALFVPLMTLVVWLAPALRRAVEAVAAAHGVSSAERDAGAQAILADIAERRHRLAVSAALVSEETAAERARLAAETARYDTDREAAGKVLAEAVEARRKAIAARAEAEAELAPEMARAALQPGGDWLAAAYADYLRKVYASDALPFGQWVQGFDGVQRG